MVKMMKIIHIIENTFASIVIALMTIITFIASINRFTLAIPMPWSEELVRILMAWLAFIGAACGVNFGAHIGINVITDNLPESVRKWVLRFTFVAGIFICVVLFLGGMNNLIRQSGQRTQAMQISIGWRYASVPCGAVLMGMEFLFLLAKSFKKEGLSSD